MGRCFSKHSDAVAQDVRLDGRVAIVTGATSGIGLVTARVLATRGCHVVLFGRNKTKLSATASDIRSYCQSKTQHEHERSSLSASASSSSTPTLTEIQCDLSSLASVQRAAQEFILLNIPLHYLVNNAGIMATPYAHSVDGFDIQLATNFLAHFYLTQLLLPKLLEAGAVAVAANNTNGAARIVNVSSAAHQMARITVASVRDDLLSPDKSTYEPWRSYGNSKLCNVLHARTLATKLKGQGVTAYSVHPGVVATELDSASSCTSCAGFFWRCCCCCMKSPEQGAATQLTALLEPGLEDFSGCYFHDCEVREPSLLARDDSLAQAVWDEAERVIAEWTAQH